MYFLSKKCELLLPNMKLIRLLLDTSWRKILLATLIGLLSGASNVGLIALISKFLGNLEAKAIASLLWSFISLCIIFLITKIASEVLVGQLSEGIIYDMRMLLTRCILASPLRRIEEVGIARLLASLTDDIQSVSTALFNFPFLCTNLAIVASCLLYLAWLSPSVFLLVAFAMILSLTTIQFFIIKARRSVVLAREQQDHLLQHFRSLIEGIKELKLHRKRQLAFISEELA